MFNQSPTGGHRLFLVLVPQSLPTPCYFLALFLRGEVAGSKGLHVFEALPSRKVDPPTPGWQGGCAGGVPPRGPAWAVPRADYLPFSSSLGPNPSEPLSSSTQWAGRQSRSCLRLCGHPRPGGGPCSPASSGASPSSPPDPHPVSSHSVTVKIRAHPGDAEVPSCCAPWSL